MDFYLYHNISFCDAPLSSGLENASFLNNLGFQDPATPLMEGIIALHSDIWAIMLFVAGFVLYMLCATLFTSPEKSYKVHHHNLIEIVWTTVPAIILCVIAIPSFTLLYSLDEIVMPSLTVKAVGRQWYWSAPFNDDLGRKINLAMATCLHQVSHSVVLSVRTTKLLTHRTLDPQGIPGINS